MDKQININRELLKLWLQHLLLLIKHLILIITDNQQILLIHLDKLTWEDLLEFLIETLKLPIKEDKDMGFLFIPGLIKLQPNELVLQISQEFNSNKEVNQIQLQLFQLLVQRVVLVEIHSYPIHHSLNVKVNVFKFLKLKMLHFMVISSLLAKNISFL